MQSTCLSVGALDSKNMCTAGTSSELEHAIFLVRKIALFSSAQTFKPAFDLHVERKGSTHQSSPAPPHHDADRTSLPQIS